MTSTTIIGTLPGQAGTRPCCLLSDQKPLFGLFNNPIIDLSMKLDHRYGTGFCGYFFGREITGILYTCSAGFIDLGHLRDLADLTIGYSGWLSRYHRSKDRFVTIGYEGFVDILKDIPSERAIEVVRGIAYDQSIFHEIETYWSTLPGNHHSAFSPEDLVSNFLGTYVAERALIEAKSGSELDTTLTKYLLDLLGKLGPLPLSGTKDALQKVGTGWFKGNPGAFYNPDYLQRRNFAENPVKPWLVSGVAGCSSPVTFSDPAPGLSQDTRSHYRITFKYPRADSLLLKPFELSPGLGKKWINTDEFPSEIAKIKDHARNKYGSNFDQP